MNNQRSEYISRINRVIDHIEKNICGDLSLKTLSKVANFSPYHFHRIFTSIIGESLTTFIQRIKIERAANQILSNPQKSITEIALDCGFSSSTSFSRLFREMYDLSARELRASKANMEIYLYKINDKNSKLLSKNRKEWVISASYFGEGFITNNWSIKMRNGKNANVVVKELPEMNVVYIRHIGSYQGDSKLFGNLFSKLMKWAGPRGLINFPETKMLSVYHDDPNVTDDSKLRLSVCLTISKDVEVSGEVGKMVITGGKYAVAKFELADNEYPEAWDSIYGGWLPESGYQPIDAPCFENYLNNPKDHPEGKCIVEICIPVQPI
jgi:AraC family transcriptional regulator